MKQEEKAKAQAYDEALERAKKLQKTCDSTAVIGWCEYIFPQLKESEDEKIRKSLIALVMWAKSYSASGVTRDDAETMLNWLEKQGEKDKLIQELGEYKVKYIQKTLEKTLTMNNKDDERLRKTTIAFLKEFANKGYENAVECIDWLEKQGESKSTEQVEPKFKVGDKIRRKAPRLYDKDMQVARIERDYYICNHIGKFSSEPISFSEESNYELVEQEPADKIEPMFRIGDWVVNNDSGVIQHIKEIENVNDETLYVFDEDSVLDINFQEQYHLWTIRDAKDGDVLAFYTEYKGNKMVQVGIIEKYVGKHGGCSNTFKIYVGVNWENNLQIGEYMGCSDIRPATKEQRDLLFQKIGESIYEWDADRKKLEKIHVIDEGKAEMDYCFTKMMNGEKVSSAWSEEDEKMIRGLIVICDEWTTRHSFYPIENCEMEKLKKWLKSLKDRVQPKQVWSKEDETMKESIIQILYGGGHFAYEPETTWLKSLKQRIGWKPSDAQMQALKEACDKHWEPDGLDPLYTLYEHLKELKE